MKSFSRVSVNKAVILVILIASLYSAVLATMLIFDRTPDIAYVNSDLLMEKYRGAIKARKAFDIELESWSKRMAAIQEEIDSLKQFAASDKNKKAGTKNIDRLIQSKEDSLASVQQQFENRGPARKKQLMEPVLVRLNDIVAKYARRHGFRMVYSIDGQSIVYTDGAVDITQEILEHANRGL